jgi:hypothetical protein
MLICAAAMPARNVSTHAGYQILCMPLVDITETRSARVASCCCCLICQFCGPTAGMARMVSDVPFVLRAPTAPPTEGMLLAISVCNALLGRPPCSGLAKLVPTAPLSACVLLDTAHLQGVHRNVQSVSAPSIRVLAVSLLPHLKPPSPPVFNALTFQPHRSLVM